MVMVFITRMDDEGRRKRGGFFRRFFNGGSWSLSSDSRHHSSYSIAAVNTPPTERRPIRSVPTIGPGHRVNPDILAKSFVEKEMKYLGTVNDISSEFDANSRNSLLSLIDEKRRLAQFPCKLGYRNDVLCSFSIHNLKISWRDGEYVIHRIPTHKISSVGFVQDDLYFYVFVQFASELSESASCLAIFSAETRLLAEEFCSLTQQMFELVYTETTMDFFDKSIADGADTPKNHSYSTDDSGERKGTVETMTLSRRLHLNIQRFLPEFARQSSGRESNSTIIDTTTHKKETTTNCNSSAPASINGATPVVPLRSESDLSNMMTSPTSSISTPATPTVQNRFRSESSSQGGGPLKLPDAHRLQNMNLQEFISLLRECLDNEELSAFAQSLHNFRTGKLTIAAFLLEIIKIYTDKRKPLLLGMRNFIPSADDRVYFDKFLKQHRIVPPLFHPPLPPNTSKSAPTVIDGECSTFSGGSKDSSVSMNVEELTEIASSVNEDDVIVEGVSDDAASTLKRNSLLEASQQETLSTHGGATEDAMDDSQCILRSGDVTGDDETSVVNNVTTVEMSKLKLELKRDRLSGGKRSRDDMRRSPTPEELGAPFPSFVSYAGTAPPRDTTDSSTEATPSGTSTTSSRKQHKKKSKSDTRGDQHHPRASSTTTSSSVTTGNPSSDHRTPPQRHHVVDVDDTDPTTTTSSTTTAAEMTSSSTTTSPQPPNAKHRSVEHRKKRKHKHKHHSQHHHVVGIVTEL